MEAIEIKKNRKRLGLTQYQLGKLIGVTALTIANYENGKVIPESKTILLYNVLRSESISSLDNLNENSLNKDKITSNKDLLSRVEATILELKSNNSLKALKELDGLIELKYKIIEVLKDLES